MRHIMTLLVALALPAAAQATEANDTVYSYNGHQIAVTDTLGSITVSVLDSVGQELVKTQETTFVDGQEIERIYVSSPFIPGGSRRHRFDSHLPALYFGNDILTGHRLGFGSPSGLRTNNGRSYEIGFSAFDLAIPFNRSHTFGLTATTQAGWVRHYLSDGFTLQNVDGTVVPEPIVGADVRKSYISYQYLRVPVLLEWQQRIKRHEVYAGVGLSYELRTLEHARYKGSTGTITPTHDLNFNTVALNLEVQAGFDGLTFFLRSALTPLMQDGRGPRCFPVSIGIGFRL